MTGAKRLSLQDSESTGLGVDGAADLAVAMRQGRPTSDGQTMALDLRDGAVRLRRQPYVMGEDLAYEQTNPWRPFGRPGSGAQPPDCPGMFHLHRCPVRPRGQTTAGGPIGERAGAAPGACPFGLRRGLSGNVQGAKRRPVKPSPDSAPCGRGIDLSRGGEAMHGAEARNVAFGVDTGGGERVECRADAAERPHSALPVAHAERWLSGR